MFGDRFKDAMRSIGMLETVGTEETPEGIEATPPVSAPLRPPVQPVIKPATSVPRITLTPTEDEEEKGLVASFGEKLEAVLADKDSPACSEFLLQFEAMSESAPDMPIDQTIKLAFGTAKASLKARGTVLTAESLINEISGLIQVTASEQDNFIRSDQETYDASVKKSNEETVGWRQEIESIKAQIAKLESEKSTLEKQVGSQDEHLQGLRLKKESRARAFTQAASEIQGHFQTLTKALSKTSVPTGAK